jgi:DNA-binding NarL/FixJ family response regulator
MAERGAMARTRVLIADDLEHVRQGLRTVLELVDDLEVIGEAGTGLEAIELVERLEPDVVLMDLVMPGLDGLEATQRIKDSHPKILVVMITLYEDARNRERARQAGVDAFVRKGVPFDQILAAIRQDRRDVSGNHPS